MEKGWIYLICLIFFILMIIYSGKSIGFSNEVSKDPNAKIPFIYSKNKFILLWLTGIFMLIIGILSCFYFIILLFSLFIK